MNIVVYIRQKKNQDLPIKKVIGIYYKFIKL